MADHITLRGLEVFARHGVFADERRSGQIFLVDVDIEMDLSDAGNSDLIVDSVDYGKLASLVHDTVAGERWDLIERVATRVAEAVLSFDGRIGAVEVTVHKPSAPIPHPFADVAVRLRRVRQDG